jgi:hypothetical protein
MKKTRVRRIQHTKTILARLDVQKRKQLSVYQNRVAKNLGDPGRLSIARDRIEQLAIVIEEAIVQKDSSPECFGSWPS